MKQLKRKREILPPWNMPSDPIKAVSWFMYWSLKVLVRFFWVPIIAMAAWETYLNWRAGGIGNGFIGGFITLLIGLIVWGVLYIVLLFFKFTTGVSQVISDIGRMQQGTAYRRPVNPFANVEKDEKVVEGTITDLEEERQKRRRE